MQVVEHFTVPYLTRFLEAASQKMRPGAPLVLETINVNCWMAFFETYLRDPTHQQPLHPDTLKLLVQSSGFSDVNVQFRAPVSAEDRLDRVTAAGTGPLAELAAALNAHADKLNRRLFSSMDYVVKKFRRDISWTVGHRVAFPSHIRPTTRFRQNVSRGHDPQLYSGERISIPIRVRRRSNPKRCCGTIRTGQGR